MKIFLDSSDINEIKDLIDKVDGVTTNPTIMRKAGVTDYEKSAKEIIAVSKGKPVSLEVFADDFDEMERQARIISSWGDNVYVKIPITNSKGESSVALINSLDLPVNVTAMTLRSQIKELNQVVAGRIFSFFAGRIADTGIDPSEIFLPLMVNIETLWASPREVLNIYQAEEAGADIITVTPELFRKYEKMKGYDLNQLSLDTVKMFHDDAVASGFKL